MAYKRFSEIIIIFICLMRRILKQEKKKKMEKRTLQAVGPVMIEGQKHAVMVAGI